MSKTPTVCPNCDRSLTSLIEEITAPLAIKYGRKAGKLNVARDRLEEAKAAKSAAVEQVTALQARLAALEAENRALVARLAGASEEGRTPSRTRAAKSAPRSLTPAQFAVVSNMR